MSNERFLTVRAKVQPARLDYEEALELAKQKSPDPSVFDQYDAVFWRAQISSNRLDFYFTSMGEPTLKNSARGLQDGISYQDSHESRRLGWGQSIDGEVLYHKKKVDVVGEPLIETYGTFMTLDNLNVNGQNTSDFVAAIRAGMWRDVSVGFFASEFICSVCGKDMWDWTDEEPCMHLPGLKYEKQLAWARVMDGELAETSQVYDGATPEAAVDLVITKANVLSEERMLGERQISYLESRYSQRIRRPDKLFRGMEPISKEDDMTVKTKTRSQEVTTEDELEDQAIDTTVIEDEADTRVQSERAGGPEEPLDEPVAEPGTEHDDTADVATDVTDDNPDVTVVEEVTTEVEVEIEGDPGDDPREQEPQARARELFSESELNQLAQHGIRLGADSPKSAIMALAEGLKRERAKVSDTRELAELGRMYKEDLIKEALQEGVRARGNDFNEDRYRAILEKSDVEDIKMFAKDFKAQADGAFVRKPPVLLGENTAEATVRAPKNTTRKRSAYRA